MRDHRNRNARFLITGARLHANNETGLDAAGSDEIIVLYHDRARDQRLFTSVFDDFDTGETRYFSPSQSCIAPAADVTRRNNSWRCDGIGAAAPINVDVRVAEVDDWNGLACATAVAGQFFLQLTGGCLSDLVGRGSIAFTAETLTTDLPHVGARKDYELRLGGYTLTYRIERAPNAMP